MAFYRHLHNVLAVRIQRYHFFQGCFLLGFPLCTLARLYLDNCIQYYTMRNSFYDLTLSQTLSDQYCCCFLPLFSRQPVCAPPVLVGALTFLKTSASRSVRSDNYICIVHSEHAKISHSFDFAR